ncbi:MAG TPA: sigma 54-interacting transcriptional regulator [Chryseolinea sp.]|nr:sigma 54-interacting transcriptional regulator [Chryseolinea sp.]
MEIAQYRHEHSRESRYRREADVLRQLEKIVVTDIDWKSRMLETVKIIQQEIPFDYLAIDDQGTADVTPIGFLRIGFDEYQALGITELSTIAGISVQRLIRILAANREETGRAYFNDEEFEVTIGRSPQKQLVAQTFQMKSLLSYPLHESLQTFTVNFYSRRPDTYNAENLALLDRLQKTLTSIFKVRRDSEGTANSGRGPFEASKSGTPDFEGMIGNSHLLLNVFDLISQVAPFDTSVLVLGESGTGKEKIAECIHNLSPRKRKPLVKVNCATLPASLIESELFGHEKGSFTGAIEKRTGKFELANGGTIFLDEIGEMPVDLQVKLLRVLQEREIEPIGSKSTVKIDVRVIAATNRNLEREVGEGRFRLDLYYRLNVFPIILPPLRARLEDIPALTQHFINICNRKAGKRITGVSDKALEDLMTYSWPGNIRELENVIERSVLLAKGATIEDIYLPSVRTTNAFQNSRESHMKTIHENERDYIISVLKKCHGKIWGSGGAAEVLRVPPSTLKSKMKKLGIPKEIGE